MRQFLHIFLILILISSISSAQILKGKITNQAGEPIQYSTVYFQELRQGTTSNTKGDYEIKLPAGKYEVTYQSLGYSPVFETITLADKKTVTKNIILPLQYYQIPEVRISASGEDPAYIIMRKVIGLAPYYLNNISYYKAEVYLKGNLIINKIPKLLQKSMKIETRNESGTQTSTTMKAGDSYLMESFNEIEFTAPDKYFQKVISINSTFPEQGKDISPMDFIEASFYQPVLAKMAISPLSPQSFSNYNFKYLGASLQGNFTIDKIQVIPKRKSQQLFEGTIYIIEDLWCLHSVDLVNENLVGRVRVQQLYIPVQDDIWMPVSHKFEINVGIMGFKADAGYGGSVKYIEVKPNLALEKPKTISTDYGGRKAIATAKPDSIVSKSKKEIDKILEKNQLSNRDMVKLANLMEKESEKTNKDSSKKNLEIIDRTTHKIEKDANKRDSAYWASIRPVPLSDIEIKSLKIRDSSKTVSSLKESKSDTTKSLKSKSKSKFITTVKEISSGHTWSDTTGFRFTNGGLIATKNLRFNTVDGFVYGVNFSFSKSWKNSNAFSISPEIRWAFSRDQLMWRLNSNYRFNGMKQQQVFMRAGMISKDISSGGSVNTFINSATSLLLKKNYLKLYESRYMTIGFRTEIINGMTIDLSSGYEDRRVLKNNTNFSLIKYSKPYSDNIPVNNYLAAGSNPLNALRDQRHADFSTRITYTPYQHYKIFKGVKTPRGSEWPTFILSYQHGINEIGEMTNNLQNYDMLKFEASKNKSIGAFSAFRWRVKAGGFLDNRNLTYYDFFHFNSQPFPLLLDNYSDAFMIPTFYSLSTPEAFGEVHLKYTTPYLLIKLLPIISNTLMRENLSLSYLKSRYHKSYTEIGYSISEILFLGELGVYAGFDDLKYKSVGVNAVLRFN